MYIDTYLPTYPATYIHTYLHTYVCIYIYIYIYIYISYTLAHMYVYAYVYVYTDIYVCIYDPGSRFAEPPPPNGIPPPPHPLPKPNLCDCAHFLHMRAPKPSSPPKPSTVTRIASQTRPILVTVSTSQRINRATVTRIAFPDRPDPCDSWPIATFWQLPPKRRLSRR